MNGGTMLVASEICRLHDEALAEWYAGHPPSAATDRDQRSLVQAEHYCNFDQWNLEDDARRTDVADSRIVETKRAIDSSNQRRNDLIERIDDWLLSRLDGIDLSSAEQHSETAGQIIDRLSILALKIRHMSDAADGGSDLVLAAECSQKLAVLRVQRDDLAQCLDQLVADFRAGRRFFKSYRQFKMYNDPRLNPALAVR